MKQKHNFKNINIIQKEGKNFLLFNKFNNKERNIGTNSQNNIVRILFGGDIFLADKINKLIEKKGISYITSKFDNNSLKYDFFAANLELPLTTNTIKDQRNMKKRIYVKGKPEYVKILSELGINCVSLSNNHIADYKYEGIKQTISVLKDKNILFFGAGKNFKKLLSQQPLIIEKNGLSFALMGFNIFFHANADKDFPGALPLELPLIKKLIKKSKKYYNYVIVVLHWGQMYSYYPSILQRIYAKAIISNGADIIIGHHPHVMQGIEIINNKPVFYSLGNILFDQRGKYQEMSFLPLIRFDKTGIKNIQIIPTHYNDSFQCSLSIAEKERECLDRLKELSNGIQCIHYSKAKYFMRLFFESTWINCLKKVIRRSLINYVHK